MASVRKFEEFRFLYEWCEAGPTPGPDGHVPATGLKNVVLADVDTVDMPPAVPREVHHHYTGVLGHRLDVGPVVHHFEGLLRSTNNGSETLGVHMRLRDSANTVDLTTPSASGVVTTEHSLGVVSHQGGPELFVQGAGGVTPGALRIRLAQTVTWQPAVVVTEVDSSDEARRAVEAAISAIQVSMSHINVAGLPDPKSMEEIRLRNDYEEAKQRLRMLRNALQSALETAGENMGGNIP